MRLVSLYSAQRASPMPAQARPTAWVRDIAQDREAQRADPILTARWAFQIFLESIAQAGGRASRYHRKLRTSRVGHVGESRSEPVPRRVRSSPRAG